MRRLEDYTKQELTTLSDKELNDLIDFECAMQGVPLLPAYPGPKPTLLKHNKVKMYRVNDYIFSTKAEADAVYAAMDKCKIYTIEGYNETARFKVLGPGAYSYPKVEIVEAMTSEEYEKREEEIKKHKVRVDRWEANKRTYDRAETARRDVVKQITDAIKEAHEHVDELQCNIDRYARYMELADNNEEMAVRFLRDASPNLEPEDLDQIHAVVTDESWKRANLKNYKPSDKDA